MTKTLLFTQCLLRDFVGPIGRFDPLPNPLHIGYHEAARLVGNNPSFSPLNIFMRWAYEQDPTVLEIFNIRDWHDPDDPLQAEHLKHFGMHGLKNTPGAEFIFDIPEELKGRKTHIINSLTLNDFQETDLDAGLAAYAGQKMRVGIIGAWTEAKVYYLSYELRTRYPDFDIAVCSALTAGSSRAAHFQGLDNLKRLLGVRVIDSVDDFVEFLGGKDFGLVQDFNESLAIEGIPASFEGTPLKLMQYLFRECSHVAAKPLDGGFSGNYVLACQGTDMNRRLEVPHVAKIGPRKEVTKEREAFYRVETILGNAAPSIVGFAEMGDWAAIKYRYASMDDSQSKSFQKIYMLGVPLTRIYHAIDQVFGHQLARLYLASNPESCNLLDYYEFDETLQPHVAALVEEVYGKTAGSQLEFPGGKFFANPAEFYGPQLDVLKALRENRHFALIHGDLNGANILEDGNKNIWLIDFFHAHYGHVIRDLIKLENDIQYICTPVETEEDLKLAMKFSDCLMATKDLATSPHFTSEIMRHPHFGRAARTIQKLRSFYPKFLANDVEPVQAMIGQMRYAMHTLSFEECNLWQKKWALYAAGNLSSFIGEKMSYSIDLQVANIPLYEERAGKLGITILPGRRDRARDLDKDIQRLKDMGVTKVKALITDAELDFYEVPGLFRAYAAHGIDAKQISVPDGAPLTHKQALALTAEIDEDLRRGDYDVIHCLGGLGRSGTAAADVLVYQGMPGQDAIAAVRQARSLRAVETKPQERSILSFDKLISARRPARAENGAGRPEIIM